MGRFIFSKKSSGSKTTFFERYAGNDFQKHDAVLRPLWWVRQIGGGKGGGAEEGDNATMPDRWKFPDTQQKI